MINQSIIEKINELYQKEITAYQTIEEGISDTFILCSPSDKFVLKIIGNSFIDNLQNTLGVLSYLQEDGFPSPKVITNHRGELSSRIDHETTCVMYQYLDGNAPEVMDYSKLGALLGALHAKMKNYEGVLVERSQYYYVDKYIDYMKAMAYPSNKIERFRVIGEDLWERVSGLSKGFSHGDTHMGNILSSNQGQYTLLDFDTVNWSFSYYDIAVMCNSTNFFKYKSEDFFESQKNYNDFLIGYNEHIILSEEEKASYYDFIGLYHFQLQATIIETYGIECIDHIFLDKQLDWLNDYLKDLSVMRSI